MAMLSTIRQLFLTILYAARRGSATIESLSWPRCCICQKSTLLPPCQPAMLAAVLYLQRSMHMNGLRIGSSMNRGLALLVAAVVGLGREAQEQAELGQGEWEEEWGGLRWGHMAAAMSGLILPRAGCKLLSNRQAMRSTPQHQICSICQTYYCMKPVAQLCGQAAGTIISSKDIQIAVSYSKSDKAVLVNEASPIARWIPLQMPYARQGPEGWTEYRAQDGQFYYFNHHTKENTWDKPACWP